MTAGWGSRTTRAAMFAAVCVLLAALGHVMMSGSHVPWWAMAAGAAATGAVGWCLAGRERGLPLITSVVVAAQTALHSGFELAQSSAATAANGHTRATSSSGSTVSANLVDMGSAHMIHTVRTGAAGHMDHVDHTGYLLDGSSASSSSLLSSLASLYASSSGMLAAHLLAALLCGLWLAYGERAAFALLRAVVEAGSPHRCGCRSRCPSRRSGRAPGCVAAVRTVRRAGSFSSMRSPLGVHPPGPLSSDDSR